MKLQKAQIQKYKCVEDSGEWRVDQVTCLVGKNEAGKSAILEALYKLNPVQEEDGKFTETDYPRRTALTDQGKADMQGAQAVITHWCLEESDLALLNDGIPELKITKGASVKVTRGYDGSRTWDVTIDEATAVSKLIETGHFNAAEKASVGAPATFIKLFQALESITGPTEKHQGLLKRLGEKYPKKTAMSGVETCLFKALPHFVYFREYERLPGKVSINELIRLEAENNLTFGLKIFQALLNLANSS
ncbi:MAG: AAA family ATPase, partial [Alphaproteobacteria bacterium]